MRVLLGRAEDTRLTDVKIHHAGEKQVAGGTQYFFVAEVKPGGAAQPQYWDLILLIDNENGTQLTYRQQL